MQDKNLTRFLLTFFLGWIGSFIINHSSLKPEGHTSRTAAYFILPAFTLGIYGLVAAFCNLTFDPKKPSNIGYIREPGYAPAEPEYDEPIADIGEPSNAPSAMQIVENLTVSEPTPDYDDSRTVDETQTDEYNGNV